MEYDIKKINIIYTADDLGDKLKKEFSDNKNVLIKKSFFTDKDFKKAHAKADDNFIDNLFNPTPMKDEGLVDKKKFALNIIAVGIDFEIVKSVFLKAYLNLESKDLKAILFRSTWSEEKKSPEIVYIFPGGLDNSLLLAAFHSMKNIDRLFLDFVSGSNLSNKLFKFIFTVKLGWTLEAQQSVKHQIQF